jgi:isocitrate lyase
METSNPDLCIKFCRRNSRKIPRKISVQLFSIFNWAAKLSVAEMETFREDLAAMGYKFTITLAGFHAPNTSMFELSKVQKKRNGRLSSELQEREFVLKHGFKAVKHQGFVGFLF